MKINKHGQKNRFVKMTALFLVFALLVTFSNPGIGMATFNPGDVTVTEGNVTFEQDANDPNIVRIINHADKSIIDVAGGGFGVDAGQTINIDQLVGSSAQLLIRDISGNLTEISGNLNILVGLVLLINTMGINISETGAINVMNGANFIASTLNIQNQLFMNGQLTLERFEGSDFSKIVNDGVITGQELNSIILLASAIENNGTIEANMGTVTLAAGDRATLSLSDNGLINFVMDKGVERQMEMDKALIENTGTITAQDGKVTLMAKTLDETLNTLINNEGLVEAMTAIEQGGQIEFISNGAIINEDAGVIRTNTFIEQGYTFKTTGTVTGGTAFYDNIDGAAKISGIIGSHQYDTGNLIVDGDITLDADDLIFAADTNLDGTGHDGVGIFTMNDGVEIDGTTATYDLTIRSADTPDTTDINPSARPNLGTFTNMGKLTLESSGGLETDGSVTKPTYTAQENLALGDLKIGTETTLDLNSKNLTFTNGPTQIENDGTLELNGDETVTNFINDIDSGLVLYSGDGNYTNRILPTGTEYYDLAFTGDGFHRLGNLNYHIRNDLRIESDAPQLPDTACPAPPCFDTTKFNVDARSARLLDIDGDFILKGGHYRASTARTTIAGDFDIQGGYYDRVEGSNGIVEFDGIGNQHLYLKGGVARDGFAGHSVFFENLTYSGDGTLRTVYRGGNANYGLRVDQNFIINGGGTYLTNNSTTIVAGGLTVTNGSAFDAASIDQSSRSQTFLGLNGKGILVEDGSSFIGGKGTVTVADEFNLGTYVHVQSGGTFVASKNDTIVRGDFVIQTDSVNGDGTFIHNDGTVTLDASAAHPIQLITGGDEFNNLIISDKGLRRVEVDSVNVLNSFRKEDSGTYDANGHEMMVQGINGGTAVMTNGNYFAGEAKQTFDTDFTISGGTYHSESGLTEVNGNLNVTNVGRVNGGSGDIDVNGNVFIGTNAIVTGPSGHFFVEGDWTNQGRFNHQNGTVMFDGDTMSDITSGGYDFNNVIVNKDNAADTINLVDDFAANGSLTVTQGTVNGNAVNMDVDQDVTIEANGTLNSTSADLHVGGNWTNEGVFNHNDGNVIFDESDNADVTSGNADFNNVIVNKDNAADTINLVDDFAANGSLTVTQGTVNGNAVNMDVDQDVTIEANGTLNSTSADLHVGGNWTNQGAFNHNDGQVVLDESSNATLDNGLDTFHNLIINKTDTSSNVQLQNNLEVENVMTMQEGTFEQNEHAITVGQAGDNADAGRETFNMDGGIFNGSSDGAEMDINGDYRQRGGDFRATSGDMYVSGNFERADGGQVTIGNPYYNPEDPKSPQQITIKTSAGNFDHNFGTFILDAKDSNAPTNQTITGSTKFYHFRKEANSPDYLTFESGSLTEVEGRTTLRGSGSSPDELLYIRATEAGQQAYFAPAYLPEGGIDRDISMVDVQDNHNLVLPVIFPTDQDVIDHSAVNSGGTTNWFPEPVGCQTNCDDPDPDPDPDPVDSNTDAELVQDTIPKETLMVCESVLNKKDELDIEEAQVFMVHPDGTMELLGKTKDEINALKNNLDKNQQAEIKEIEPDQFIRCVQVREDQELTSE